VGGSVTALTGIQFVLNLPTEEIYTIPHRERINGYVTASMPLSRSGTIIEGIKLEFEHGRITQAEASKGEELFLKLIATDEGMGSLGEVALVPHSSPIAQEGILFYDTLLDENAASHLALGAGYRFCLKDAEKISDEEYAARGGNSSLLHIDFMIGSPEMDVNGIFIDGSPEPVMRAGEWAFDL
jgi:aminopeptidase